ncbi:MAG: ABC transporter ATP-binding protein [Candidatus Hydrogenedentes bacterium]|nr:ABC transporter ATP-binding protein [Candidatus Hydrogenedentota bacterium]
MDEEKTILNVLDVHYLTQENLILKGISIDIWSGYIHAIVGPNGAGKSTLVSCIMGLPGYEIQKGKIIFDGEDITDLPVYDRARRGLTLAWQEPARFEGLKIKDFVLIGAKNKCHRKAEEVLDLVGLDPKKYLNRAVDKTLSGGERKRIELASIIAMEPKLILLDEPDSGIDIEALQKIFDLLELIKKQGITIVLITHSPVVLERADHAFLMCCGRILDKGSIERISNYFRSKCIPCDHNIPG